MLRRGFDVHPGTPWVWRDRTELWSEETCSFCGSIRPETFLEFLRAGYGASGTDWKPGWPHKFYVADESGSWWKFYVEHMIDMDVPDEKIEGLTQEIAVTLQIKYEFDDLGRLSFKAPSQNYKTWRKHPKEGVSEESQGGVPAPAS